MVLTLAMGWSHIGHAADKTIEVAVNVNDYPFGFIDDNNKISGYDGELLQLIEKNLTGYKFHFNSVSRDALIVGFIPRGLILWWLTILSDKGARN